MWSYKHTCDTLNEKKLYNINCGVAFKNVVPVWILKLAEFHCLLDDFNWFSLPNRTWQGSSQIIKRKNCRIHLLWLDHSKTSLVRSPHFPAFTLNTSSRFLEQFQGLWLNIYTVIEGVRYCKTSINPLNSIHQLIYNRLLRTVLKRIENAWTSEQDAPINAITKSKVHNKIIKINPTKSLGSCSFLLFQHTSPSSAPGSDFLC